MVKDEADRVRVSVADSLGRIGGPDSVAVLLELAEDENARVREIVAKALHKNMASAARAGDVAALA